MAGRETISVGVPEIVAYWRSRIAQDLFSFADPGTEVVLGGEGRSITAAWFNGGTEQQAVFTVSPDQGVQVVRGGQVMPYRAFLAGPEMADLLGLAKSILRTYGDEFYIETKALLELDGNTDHGLAIDVINRELSNEPAQATKIVMITGEAGCGKTRVLRELVRRQALEFRDGQADALYLYVNAQGRALARLAEALATELQDLRARVTYHSIAALVRLGVLVPVIDGFDELIGVSGYDDAFASLSRFITELDGEGQIVASARSTYYEEEFVTRTVSSSSLGGHIWTQVPIRVSAWGVEEFHDYVERRVEADGGKPEDVGYVISRLNLVFAGVNAALRDKPLFVSHAVGLVLSGADLGRADDLRTELIASYLEREQQQKLLDRNQSPLLEDVQLRQLLQSLAEEMWNLGTRELDRRTVREIAEYVLQAVMAVPEDSQQIIIERMPSLAFLAPGTKPGSIRFEHEVFFSAFLAMAFAEALRPSGVDPRMLLSRSALPPEVAEYFVGAVIDTGSDLSDQYIRSTLEAFAAAGSHEGTKALQIRENAGRLAAALLKHACAVPREIRGLQIRNVVFPGGDLEGVTVVRSTVESVTFRRVDLRRTRLLDCHGTSVLFEEVTVDPEFTRLEIRGVDLRESVFGLRTIDGDRLQQVFDPVQVAQVLVACGALPEEPSNLRMWDVPPASLQLVERLMRAYGRANPVCKSDPHLAVIFDHPGWPLLERLLLENSIVELEIRAAGGPRKEFLRRRIVPDELLAGLRKDARVPPNVRGFWAALEREKL
jgi:hypothetical protein